MANPTPPRLNITQLGGIHTENPPVGKALQQVADYINENVTPAPGNKVPTRKSAPGGNPGSGR